ncbi:MAG: calcium/sodium antiporter [Rhodobiaceae bacterium]|nr:calcium/sodium antiporter [Rhodobiaceae bacterium]MCC0011836.1 calcium/sodium antiporter [Rhodobiaceae bacterium]MCC0050507.1 calcium/sodium antiporter [Rhodobiaceae bacterium]MCC0061246.1 calcium/sodium antiporter [Rhodobiaceae bacterium]
MLPYVMFVLGLALLMVAGDLLVRGAVGIADHLNIPPLVIGLTVVAFGTSAPELVVCINAALDGSPAIAVGNVIGSNIANVLLVLGVPALIAPTVTDQQDALRNTLYMIGATLVFFALCLTGALARWQGMLLFSLLILFLWESVRCSRNGSDLRDEIEQLEGPAKNMTIAVLFAVGGLVGLPLAAEMMVSSAQTIARSWGISEAAIGLTVVALGTSLPELAATVMAAIRREGAIAIGNVIGSNIFNLLGIMGVTSLIAPLSVPPEVMRFDIWIMLISAVVVLAFVGGKWRINAPAGLALTVAYVIYCWSVFNNVSLPFFG